MNIVLASEIQREDGLTQREHNQSLLHSIPLGSLVEIDLNYSNKHGLRLFVCEQNRDCDGEPLYSLTSDIEDLFPIKQTEDDRLNALRDLLRQGRIIHGMSVSCLKVIERGESVLARVKKE